MNETKPLSAALWMLGAMLMIGVIDNFIVVMAREISVWQLYVCRVILALPLIWLAARVAGVRFAPRRWGPALLRGFCLAAAMLFYFAALAFMPIAQALAGLFTSPIIVVVITAVFLGERIGAFRIGAVLVGFVGTVMVLQVDPENLSLLSFVPVMGGVMYAIGAIITRRMCGGESTHALLATMMGMQGLLGVLGLAWLALFGVAEAEGALAFVTRSWVWASGATNWIVFVHILGSIVGVFALTRAYQLGEASYVAIFEYSIMIFGPLFAYYWFGDGLAPVQMAGIALIIAAGAVIALRSARG